jgi:hypothetical protein
MDEGGVGLSPIGPESASFPKPVCDYARSTTINFIASTRHHRLQLHFLARLDVINHPHHFRCGAATDFIVLPQMPATA